MKTRLFLMVVAITTGFIFASCSNDDDNIDTEAPSIPQNLEASNISTSGCILNWDASTDNVGVDGYIIYQNGSTIDTTSSTSFTVTGGTLSTTYVYSIKAVDAEGNLSGSSNEVTVTTLDYLYANEIYSDTFEEGITNDTQADGDLSYSGTDQPYAGNYCITWSNAARYEAITMNFDPDIDLSEKVDSGYVLDMFIRGAVGTDTGYALNIRFVDTKTGENDHPWRNLITVDNTLIPWDGEWHRLRIPLSDFKEQGSWDGAWYSPQGLFDWSAIDKIELVGEKQAMSENDMISFDNISISYTPITSVSRGM